ncbi:hypothetical protein MJO29_007469, partial [Puccinia striiformis f. sp. tritici]
GARIYALQALRDCHLGPMMLPAQEEIFTTTTDFSQRNFDASNLYRKFLPVKYRIALVTRRPTSGAFPAFSP